jgi:hypothetical protein
LNPGATSDRADNDGVRVFHDPVATATAALSYLSFAFRTWSVHELSRQYEGAIGELDLRNRLVEWEPGAVVNSERFPAAAVANSVAKQFVEILSLIFVDHAVSEDRDDALSENVTRPALDSIVVRDHPASESLALLISDNSVANYALDEAEHFLNSSILNAGCVESAWWLAVLVERVCHAFTPMESR